jgi:hypothetical protein
MCHKYLKMDFGSKINFVIGHNGSEFIEIRADIPFRNRKLRPIIAGGKSAILTGLTVALGAKAMVTNRASNLGNLVKAGTK